MKKQILAMLACLALLLSLLPAGFAPKAEAAAVTAEQTLEQRRQAVFDYMMSMATVMWRATEDITYTFGTYTVNIVKGRLYRGIPYTYAVGNYESFMEYAGEPDEKGVHEISGLTSEMLAGSSVTARVGMSCSGAANAAYGSISVTIKQASAANQVPANGFPRVALDKYVVKPSETTNSDGKDVCTANGEQVMYSIYAEAQLADLWVCSGHTMMNHYVNVVYNEDGTINGDESTVVVVHQTPGYIRSTTSAAYYTEGEFSEENYGERVYKCFGVDEAKSFKSMYDSGYMPVTCKELINADSLEKSTISDTVTEHSFATLLSGTLYSNYQINSVTMTITDENGKQLQQGTARCYRSSAVGSNSNMDYDLSMLRYENPEKMVGVINPNLLGVGNYHCCVDVRLFNGDIHEKVRDFDFAVTEDDLCEGWVDNSSISDKFAAGTTLAVCPTCGGDAVEWVPLPQITTAIALTPGTHYYLTGDLNNGSYYKVGGDKTEIKTCIHLNGHDLISSSRVVQMGLWGRLHIMGIGKVVGAGTSESYGSNISFATSNAEVHLHGGTFGHTASTTRPTIFVKQESYANAATYLYGGATLCRMNGALGPNVDMGNGYFYMKGGLIVGGWNPDGNGGNIVIRNTLAKNFVVSGGIIAEGLAKNGGNVYIIGSNSLFTMEGGEMYLGIAGYPKKTGSGGNIYADDKSVVMQSGGTISYGKCYNGGGNIYAVGGANVTVGGIVEKGNGDYDSDGISGGNIYLYEEGTSLTVTGTVRDNYTAANGGNVFAALNTAITIDGGTVSGGVASGRGGNIYITNTGGTLTVKNQGKIENGTAANGGNVGTNIASTIILESGSITGGTATTSGPNIRFHAGATLLAKGGKIDGGLQLNTGKLELSGDAEVSGITFTTGKLTVHSDWTGNASVKWSTAYGEGDTVTDANGAATGAYTGKLTILDTENRIVANGENQLFVKSPAYTVTFKNDDGTVISSAEYFAGDTVIVPADPTKAEDETYTYEFAGWTPEVAATVTGNAEYTATYTATKVETPVVNAIVKQPEDVVVDSGETVQFSVVAEGEVVSYKWEYRKIYKWFNTAMTGYDTDTLTVPATGQRNGYDYRCTVTFADGTVIVSEPAELTVKTYMDITYSPNDQTVVLGYKGQFTAAAEGEGIKYQWQYKRPGSDLWIDTAMEGCTKPTVMIETTTARDGYQYRCGITDVTGNVQYTEAATMRVLSFKEHPVETFAPTTGTVTFSITTSVDSGFTYQWQYRRSATGNWTNTTLTGCNTDTLTVPAKGKNGYEYRCVLTGSKNSKIESKGAVLHVGDPVVFTTQPADATAVVGDVVPFAVETSNAYAYQWQYCRPGSTTWNNTGADGNQTATLNWTVKSNNNGYKLRCVIYGLDGIEYYSDIATLTVG